MQNRSIHTLFMNVSQAEIVAQRCSEELSKKKPNEELVKKYIDGLFIVSKDLPDADLAYYDLMFYSNQLYFRRRLKIALAAFFTFTHIDQVAEEKREKIILDTAKKMHDCDLSGFVYDLLESKERPQIEKFFSCLQNLEKKYSAVMDKHLEIRDWLPSLTD